MAVTTTIGPGPRSTELEGLTEAIESHPIWTELRRPDTRIAATRQPYQYATENPLNAQDRTGLCWSVANEVSAAADIASDYSEAGVEFVEHFTHVWEP